LTFDGDGHHVAKEDPYPDGYEKERLVVLLDGQMKMIPMASIRILPQLQLPNAVIWRKVEM
jgi:hypothetical protein